MPATGWPALTAAGKFNLTATSATATPPMTAAAELLAGLGSVVAELIAAVTLDVPEGGWV